jgi:hypothetical protein
VPLKRLRPERYTERSFFVKRNFLVFKMRVPIRGNGAWEQSNVPRSVIGGNLRIYKFSYSIQTRETAVYFLQNVMYTINSRGINIMELPDYWVKCPDLEINDAEKLFFWHRF